MQVAFGTQSLANMAYFCVPSPLLINITLRGAHPKDAVTHKVYLRAILFMVIMVMSILKDPCLVAGIATNNSVFVSQPREQLSSKVVTDTESYFALLHCSAFVLRAAACLSIVF